MKVTLVRTPIRPEVIASLGIGDFLEISGEIFCGRDAVLPRITAMSDIELADRGILLEGGVVFHTAVSLAGIGPTTSSKLEIEESIAPLSARGIRIHLGKGSLKPETAHALMECGSLYATTTPTSALLTDRIQSLEVAAFPELGMEAFYRLRVERIPAVVAVIHGLFLIERPAM